jgi:hypothetical protein
VVGFDEGDVMARLDACGEAVWKREGVYHHLMSMAEDGTLWVWRGENSQLAQYQYVHNFDPETGNVIRELGLIEDLIGKSESFSVAFGLRTDYPFTRVERDPQAGMAWDILHPNDVDVLGSSEAHLFPLFEAGDLLLSFRSPNLIAVVDAKDGRAKWWSNGPWIGQHDPDFAPDGKISVLSNNTGRGRSEILKMDPVTREVINELRGGELSFYSDFMGVHQYLPNGNVLIVAPSEGRAFEVTAEGDYVMEFNNLSPRHATYNEHIENGLWLPLSFFDALPACSH